MFFFSPSVSFAYVFGTLNVWKGRRLHILSFSLFNTFLHIHSYTVRESQINVNVIRERVLLMKSFGTILSEINGENWDKYTFITRAGQHIDISVCKHSASRRWVLWVWNNIPYENIIITYTFDWNSKRCIVVGSFLALLSPDSNYPSERHKKSLKHSNFDPKWN